jgi:hypothetical protein
MLDAITRLMRGSNAAARKHIHPPIEIPSRVTFSSLK